MLAILTGVSPAQLGLTQFTLDQFTLPAQVPVALPSPLVHKRFDILEAEARLHAATAAVGVATAELYPNITLGTNIAQASSPLGSLFKGTSNSLSNVCASAALPLRQRLFLALEKQGAGGAGAEAYRDRHSIRRELRSACRKELSCLTSSASPTKSRSSPAQPAA